MPSSRRGFLAASTATVVGTAGCLGLGSDSTTYQLVGGVEWKVLRGTRDTTIEKIATNRPDSGGAPVVDQAPIDLDLQTIASDTSVLDLSGTGPLVLSSDQLEQIESGYDDPYGVLVLTVYNEDPHNDVPIGNSNGYHATLDQFNEVDPGDRVTVSVSESADVPTIESIVDVTSAPQRTQSN